MTTHFKARIRHSIANEALQIALDNNTQRRLKGRAVAFESLPDWRERRQRAHAVRADVISHLDEYRVQFIAKVEQNGIIVSSRQRRSGSDKYCFRNYMDQNQN